MDRLVSIPKRVLRIIRIGSGVLTNTYTVFQSLNLGLIVLTPVIRLQQLRSKIIVWLLYMYLEFVLSWFSSAHRITNNDQPANHPRSPPTVY